jgi:AcrR family transcriptional regulator
MRPMSGTLKPHLPPGLALAWGEAPTPRRGPKAAHSVQELVEAAIALADAEGIVAMTLPRIAGRVGLTTNALYRYVGSKEELFVLSYDAAWGEPPKSPLRGRNWRNGARAWARALIGGYLARPWLLDVPIRGAPATPNVLRWLEAFLHSMANSGLSIPDRLRCAQLLDGYARSIARLSRDLGSRDTPQLTSAPVVGFLLPRLQAQGFQLLASLLSGGYYATAFDDDDVDVEEDVEFGLERILDGIDVLITRKKARRRRRR